jgi:hypothetical protein
MKRDIALVRNQRNVSPRSHHGKLPGSISTTLHFFFIVTTLIIKFSNKKRKQQSTTSKKSLQW